MSSRRAFILQTAAAGGALAVSERQGTFAATRPPRISAPLRVLILGGTGFIGPHFARAALERGHAVSVFSRGKAETDLPTGVERLTGDRNGDLKSIKNRDWDAVFDLATFVPNWVRTLGEALRGRVRHYTFISTIMAYSFPGAVDESSKLEIYTGGQDPYALTDRGEQYGALKVLCEREAEKQFPEKTLVLRPGHIVGPGEHVGLLTYLAARIEHGGEVVAGGNPLTQVQLIDVRDLAEFAVRSAERGLIGPFTMVGPALPLGWAELLGGVRAAFPTPMTLTWVPISWLVERGLQPTSALLFWPSQMGIPGFTELNNVKARANGLTFRPLNTTVIDAFAWYKTGRTALLGVNGQAKTLEDSMACERELLAVWHTRCQVPDK